MTHNIGIDEKIQATITKIEGLASPILWRASRNECLCRQHQNAERRDDCLDLLSEAVRPVIADLYRQQEQLLNALEAGADSLATGSTSPDDECLRCGFLHHRWLDTDERVGQLQ